jgi:hypothetical protein
MSDPTEAKPESKSEPLNLRVTPSEMRAVEFVRTIHGTKYEGVSSVLRDYSVAQCLAIHEKAKEEVAA